MGVGHGGDGWSGKGGVEGWGVGGCRKVIHL